MPRFAANLGFLFTEHPLPACIDAAAAAGFKAVELQHPYDVPAADVKAAIERNNLTMLGVNTPRGGGKDDFGLAAVPSRERDFDAAFTTALDYITAIGGLAIHCLSGVVAPDARAEAERTFVSNLTRAADRAAERGITLLVEPINQRDRPDYFLYRVEHAADIIAKVGKPNVRMQFDLYHAQIVGGDLITRFETYLPVVGHVQCASVPGRHEPDEGEINYPAVFDAVDRLGYRGWIGAEYRPRGPTEAGLGWAAPYAVTPRG